MMLFHQTLGHCTCCPDLFETLSKCEKARLSKQSLGLTKVHHRLVSLAVNCKCLEMAVQYFLVRMQNEAKVPTECMKFHFLYGVVRMVTVFVRASFNHCMAEIISMHRFIIPQIFVKLRWNWLENVCSKWGRLCPDLFSNIVQVNVCIQKSYRD